MKQTKGTFTYYLLRNFWWKIASLILASLIWLIISNLSLRNSSLTGELDDEPIKTRVLLRQEIHLLTKPGNHSSLVMDPSYANLTIQGPESRIDQLKENDVILFVKLPDNIGNQVTTLRVQAYRPRGIAVVEMDPLAVVVQDDKQISSDLPPTKTNTHEQF